MIVIIILFYTTFVLANNRCQMSQMTVKFVKKLLVALFMSYYISSTAFYHTHNFYWGSVTHSHPYMPLDKNSENHTHTPLQCQAIHLLTNIVLTCLVVSIFVFKSTLISRIYFPVCRYKFYYSQVFSSLRAPPAFICK